MRSLVNSSRALTLCSSTVFFCNVTNTYKKKGNRTLFDSYRGLFGTPVFRNILDKLLYFDMYEAIDDSMTDCNVGSRKRRNIRDNLFVINTISNKAKVKTNEACDICVYDVKKCHDTLWLHECITELWEAGIQDDKLVLLFLENKSAQIAIKTSSGISERISKHNKIMQGTVWANHQTSPTPKE